MNEFKGTPGPWIKREIEGAFHNQKAYAIDFNEDQEQVVDYVYREEDANLIAAAQELLKALIELLEYAELGWDHFPEVAFTARAVIAKATSISN